MASEELKALESRVIALLVHFAFDAEFSSDQEVEDAIVRENGRVESSVAEHEFRNFIHDTITGAIEDLCEPHITVARGDGSSTELAFDPDTFEPAEPETSG